MSCLLFKKTRDVSLITFVNIMRCVVLFVMLLSRLFSTHQSGLSTFEVSLHLPKAVFFRCSYSGNQTHIYVINIYFQSVCFYGWESITNLVVRPFSWHYFELDTTLSSKGVAEVRNFTMGTTGIVKCEENVEAPWYNTATAPQPLDIVIQPKIINIEKNCKHHIRFFSM